jgi:predicted Fe-S protein YdhL (DUF1289 family)
MGTFAPGGTVPSPCTSVCTIDQVTGYCAGCFRTLDEIAMWSVLDDADKRAVWSELRSRRAAHPGLKPGVATGTGTDGDR